jgi:gamma-polyglutamate synthase
MALEQVLQASNPTPYHEKLNRQLHEELLRDFSEWRRAQGPERTTPATVCEFFRTRIERGLDRLWLLDERHHAFQQVYPVLTSESERLEALLNYARQLGADERHVRGDRRAAASRWFGPDAINDRWRKRRLETQRRLADLFQRWGLCLKQEFDDAARNEPFEDVWDRSGGSVLFERLASVDADARVQQSALSALRTGLSAIRAELDVPPVPSETLALIREWGRDTGRGVWVQAEAHRLLLLLIPDEFAELLANRLQNPRQGDDLFVRARLLHCLPELDRRGMPPWQLLSDVARDPSEFVRQEACAMLTAGGPSEIGQRWLRRIAQQDESPRVRAAALAAARSTVTRSDWEKTATVDLLANALASDRDDFVLRVAARVAGDWLSALIDANAPAANDQDPPELQVVSERIRTKILPRLQCLREEAEEVPLRRQLALESERLWMLMTPHIRNTLREIREEWSVVRPGRSRRFPKKYRDALGDDLGRALAVLAQDDYGYDLERSWLGWRLRRGERRVFRTWRALHELQHPSPDKRQAHDHTIGRRSQADIRAPSAIMSELSETKVPGEPLFMSDEGSWKPFLPLLDDVLSAAMRVGPCRPVRFYTGEGVTVLNPPRPILKRWLAICRITLGFSKLAGLRNWRQDSQHRPNEYASALRRLGCDLSFTPYDAESPQAVHDDSVTRYFASTLIGMSSFSKDAERFISDLFGYFHSPYQNTSWHLTLFVGGMALLFLGRHLYVNWSFRRHRKSIPLSIGGWGTRGKSGTERLKAALFCSLGYNVVSKSTGCEAMFMVTPPLGRLRELFLFRPYDKATIWEQQDVMRLAHAWGADVFLWECMGLTPAYVDVLQRQWMKDDITTITNTYPDHEDLQGPAGADVARTIAGFVPLDSKTLTTEREMRPVLEQSARDARTRMQPVGWLESGLIPEDILARFSYQEHPDNIALVTALAAELGIPRDVALKAMADELVADLGVLKTFPPAHVRTRIIEFTNGMSANERLGCLGNWTRLGFDLQDYTAEPGVYVTTVVNNRADRVARSRVFAELIVNDLNVDRHVLIGNNLKGMQGYIAEAWDKVVADLHLWSNEPDGNDPPAEQVLEEQFLRHRRPTAARHVQDRLDVMLEAVLPAAGQQSARASLLEEWREPESVASRLRQLGVADDMVRAVHKHHAELVDVLNEYDDLAAKVRNARPDQRESVTHEFRESLSKWMPASLVVVEDYHATGEQVVQQIVNATPPGFHNRVMGIQNIKGTGLDFVYQFQAWDVCHALCRKLLSDDETAARDALRELSEFREFGLLSEECVLQAIAAAEQRTDVTAAKWTQELVRLRERVEHDIASIRESFEHKSHHSGPRQAILDFVEKFLDLGDAVWRRKRAEQIYRDIMSERISLDRAVSELRGLTKRQKGGWLARSFAGDAT